MRENGELRGSKASYEALERHSLAIPGLMHLHQAMLEHEVM